MKNNFKMFFLKLKKYKQFETACHTGSTKEVRTKLVGYCIFVRIFDLNCHQITIFLGTKKPARYGLFFTL